MNKLLSSVEYRARVAQFAHDLTQPLDLQESSVEYREGIAIHDVSYASVASGRVAAFLVAPASGRKFAGILWVHRARGSRRTFLDEAVRLAGDGAVSLLIDAPWSRGEAWRCTMGEPDHDRREYIQTTQNLSRAIDLLVTLQEVDAERLAYVGHGLGALMGGILSGVEERIRTWVLMAGIGSFADVAALSLPRLQGAAPEHYRQVLRAIDPIHYIQYAAPAPLLFQFGLQDRLCPRDRFVGFAAAGSEPKVVKWYNADHTLSAPDACRDRWKWLHAHLNLDRPGQAQAGARNAGATPHR